MFDSSCDYNINEMLHIQSITLTIEEQVYLFIYFLEFFDY